MWLGFGLLLEGHIHLLLLSHLVFMLINLLNTIFFGQVFQVWDPTLLHLSSHQFDIVALPLNILLNQLLNLLTGFAQKHRRRPGFLDLWIKITLGYFNLWIRSHFNPWLTLRIQAPLFPILIILILKNVDLLLLLFFGLRLFCHHFLELALPLLVYEQVIFHRQVWWSDHLRPWWMLLVRGEVENVCWLFLFILFVTVWINACYYGVRIIITYILLIVIL